MGLPSCPRTMLLLSFVLNRNLYKYSYLSPLQSLTYTSPFPSHRENSSALLHKSRLSIFSCGVFSICKENEEKHFFTKDIVSLMRTLHVFGYPICLLRKRYWC
jgi:hypothetical protein